MNKIKSVWCSHPLNYNVLVFSRVLIDTGDGQQPEYLENLSQTLRENSIELSSIILTHWHHDHVGGVPAILDKIKVQSYVSYICVPKRSCDRDK